MTTSQPPFGAFSNPYDIGPVSAGWYPVPDGGRKYWDGDSWLQLPDPDREPPRPSAAKKVILAIVGTAVLGSAIAGGVVWKSAHDAEVRNDAIAASSSRAAEKAAADAAAAEAEARRVEAAERARRASAVDDIESSIQEMAAEHVAMGFIRGPILSVSCDPVSGSTSDFTAETTIFSCFVATEQLAGGSARGFTYHATMNWDTGRYTYGYGAP